MEKPEHHFKYSNRVSLTLSERTLVISGWEEYVDYIEILDRRTGISMAHKDYRVGFMPPKDGDLPFIGGPIER